MPETNDVPILRSREIDGYNTPQEYAAAISTVLRFTMTDFMPMSRATQLEHLTGCIRELQPALRTIALNLGLPSYRPIEINIANSEVEPSRILGSAALSATTAGSYGTQPDFQYMSYRFSGPIPSDESLRGRPDSYNHKVSIQYEHLPQGDRTMIVRSTAQKKIIYRVGLPDERVLDLLSERNPLAESSPEFAGERRSGCWTVFSPFREDSETIDIEGYSHVLQQAAKDILPMLPQPVTFDPTIWTHKGGSAEPPVLR